MMPFDVLQMAHPSAGFLSSDEGFLVGTFNDNNSTTALSTAAQAMPYAYTSYDPLGWKQSTTVYQAPKDGLIRLIGDAYLTGSTNNFTHRSRKWNGSAYVNHTGGLYCRPFRGVGNEQDENAHSAILAVTAGDKFQFWKENGANSEGLLNGGTRNFFSAEVIPPGTRYCFATRSASQALVANVKTDLQFNDPDVADTLNCHDPSSNSHQFVMPADISRLIRINAHAAAGAANTGTLSLKIAKNGVDIAYGANNLGAATPHANVVSPVLAVAPGDVITVNIQLSAGTTTSTGDPAWVCIEELPANHRYCLLQKTANQTITTGSQITWDNEVHDPEGWHDILTNPQRVNIPSDAKEYRVTHGLTYSAAGYLYTNHAGQDQIGMAACANGRTVFNAMSPWRKIGSAPIAPYHYSEGYAANGTVVTGGVSTSFLCVEVR